MSFRAAVPLLTMVLGLACLAAVPVAARTPVQDAGCQPAIAMAPAPGFLYQAVRGRGVGDGEIGGPSALSTCEAQCQDGSTVTCTGSTCNATDADCPAERGFCSGSDTGTRYCPVCTCSASALCPDGSTVTCTGTGGTCFGIKGCYASCNGNLTWCDPRAKLCPIETES